MNWETWIPLLVALVSVAMQVWQWISNKKARDAGLASDYLKIADMTGEQLEKKINKINVLEKDIEALQAQITAVQLDARNHQLELLQVIEALKAYIKILIDILRKHEIEIPPRPDILKESNPKIPRVK
jgi:uncharacterized protein (UPF0335 family)